MSAVKALKTALRDEDTVVRKCSAQALARIGPASAVEALKAGLQHEDEYLRKDSAHALGVVGSKAASTVEPLKVALKDKEGIVRQAAARALGRIGSEMAVNALIGALQDEFCDVRRAAYDALRQAMWTQPVGPMSTPLEFTRFQERLNTVRDLLMS